jgi:hypothetical protein
VLRVSNLFFSLSASAHHGVTSHDRLYPLLEANLSSKRLDVSSQSFVVVVTVLN